MDSDIMLESARGDPRYTRRRRREMMHVVRIAANGIEVRGSTYEEDVSPAGSKRMQRTLLNVLHPGKPLSLANDHIILEVVATSPIIEKNIKESRSEASPVVAAFERVQFINIWRNG
jgi:hypothetical protein